MSQHSNNGRELNEFLSSHQEVTMQDVADEREHSLGLQDAIDRSNTLLHAAWETREENPLPWIHNSIRWRLLHRTISQYADDAGMNGNFAVKTLENPQTNRDMRIHESAHLSVAHLSRLQKKRGQPKALLAAGNQRLIDSLVEPYKLQTERLLVGERIAYGPSSFEEQTKATSSLRARIVKGRITPFADMVSIMRQLHFIDDEDRTKNNPEVWDEEHIQKAYEAFVSDQVAQGAPEQVAQAMAVVEFMGYGFTKNELKVLGLSQTTRKALTQKQIVPVDRLEPLREPMIASLGQEPTEELYDLWSDESRKQKGRTSYSKQLRTAIANLNAEPAILLPAFDIDPSDVTGHEVMRSSLERGPSKKVQLVALIHVLATNEKELRRYENRSRSDLRTRRAANLTKASFKLPAELQYCGIDIEDLGYSDEQLEQYAALQRGDESPLKEKEVLDRMYAVACEKFVVPVLERWIESQEPRDAGSMLELLAMRKSRGIRQLVKDAATSEMTLNSVRRGEMQPQHALLKDFARAASVVLPAHVETDCLLQTAEAEKSSDQKPLGRAINALISRTHRHAKTFRRDHEINMADRTFATYLSEASELGATSEKLITEVCAKAESDDKDALAMWLTLLQELESEKEALAEWIERMKQHKQSAYLDGLAHLQEMLQPASHEESEQEVGLDELKERNFRLNRWKYGKPNPESKQKEDLSSPEERAALKTLLLLPGVTRETLQTFSLKEVQQQRAKEAEQKEVVRRGHTERVLKMIPGAEESGVLHLVEDLISGDRLTYAVFYGDSSNPGTDRKLDVMAMRRSLGFESIHIEEDTKLRDEEGGNRRVGDRILPHPQG